MFWGESQNFLIKLFGHGIAHWVVRVCTFVTHGAIVTNGIVWQNTLWLACEIVWLWNYIIAFNLAIYS